MPNTYHHLSAEERAVIMIQHDQGVSASAIAHQLGRHRSTIARELHREGSSGRYCATRAAKGYRQRRTRCVRPRKLAEGTELFGRVHNMLRYRQWSPEQIAEQLKLRHPEDPAMRVSHEQIYAAIYAYPKNELRRVFIEQLRQAKPKRGRRSTATQYATIQVPDSLTIHQRDEQIETRQLAGHCCFWGQTTFPLKPRTDTSDSALRITSVRHSDSTISTWSLMPPVAGPHG